MILLTAGSNYISLVRVQTVVAEGLKSSPQMVDKGVPQGAILGSLLFILYINIIEFILIQHWNIHFYADDTIFYAILQVTVSSRFPF